MKIITAIAACAMMATAAPAFAQMYPHSGKHHTVGRMTEGRASAPDRYRNTGGGNFGQPGGYDSATPGYQNGNMAPGGGPGVHD